MVAEGQADTIESDMEVNMKHRGGTEFLPEKKFGTYGHSWMFVEHLWRPSSGCEHGEG